MPTVPMMVMIVRMMNTMEFAIGVSSIASPVSRAPSARPPVSPTLPRMAPSRFSFAGASSTSTAVNAAVAAPPATPCTMRPAITHPTSGARRKRTFDTI